MGSRGLELVEENTRSRTGLHERLRVYFVAGEGLSRIQASERIPTRGTYSRGKAYLVRARVPEGSILVELDIVKNLKGHIRGVIRGVRGGEEVLYAVIRKRKVYIVKGRGYEWIVERILSLTGLDRHVRGVNYSWRSRRGARGGYRPGGEGGVEARV